LLTSAAVAHTGHPDRFLRHPAHLCATFIFLPRLARPRHRPPAAALAGGGVNLLTRPQRVGALRSWGRALAARIDMKKALR
jgi:hypothetical protein